MIGSEELMKSLQDENLALKLELEEIKEKEEAAYQKCDELVQKHQLQMRLVDAKYTFDRKKLTFLTQFSQSAGFLTNC